MSGVSLGMRDRLQGFQPEDLPLREMRVSQYQLASAMGNACSLNVVVAILPKALYLSKLITKAQYRMACGTVVG